MNNSFFKTIAGASLLIIVFNILSRFLGFFREIIFASSFGAGREFELYLISSVFPIVINIILFYLGQNYFIPLYNKTKITNIEFLRSFTIKTLFVFTLFSLVIAILLFVFSKVIISFYLTTSESGSLILANNLFRLLLLTIPLTSIASILSAYFQAEYDFITPIISQIILNLCFIFVLFAFSGLIQVYSITIAYIFGTVLQVLFLVFKTRYLFINFSFRGIIKIEKHSFAFGSLFVMIFIEVCGQMNLVIDRYFYDLINQGGLALLNFAITIFYLPIAFISLSFSLALFPKMSEAYLTQKKKTFEKYFSDGVFIIIFLFTFFSLLFFNYGNLIIELMYQRGKFGITETQRSYELLKILTLSLVFYGIYSIVYRIFFVVNKTFTLLIISLIGVSIKLSLNFLFVQENREIGLALSTTLVYIFMTVLSILYLLIKRVISFSLQDLKQIILIIMVSCFSYLVNYLLSFALNVYEIFNIIVSMIVFTLTYFITAYYINNRALFIIINSYFPPLRNKFLTLTNQELNK